MAAVDGTWNIVMNTPMGAQDVAVAIRSDGDTFSGTANSPFGSQDFTGGTIDGDRLTWSMDVSVPMPMTIDFDAVVTGDEVSGTAQLGAFGTATFSGTRAA